MKILLLFVAAISLNTFAQDHRVALEMFELRNESISKRLDFWSERFIGVEYGANGPLGEGNDGRFDQDPLYRFDKFDCTTFVETIISLSNSPVFVHFPFLMNQIRYANDVPNYLERNHIISASWIPNNIDKGFFVDTTSEFDPNMVEFAKGQLDFGGWLAFHTPQRLKLPGAQQQTLDERIEELKLLSNEYSPEEVELGYISIIKALDNWDEFISRLKGYYVLNIVRPNWNLAPVIGTNLHISHQGILKTKPELQFIHASSAGKVMKVSLREYLEKIKDSKTIKGINLLRINE